MEGSEKKCSRFRFLLILSLIAMVFSLSFVMVLNNAGKFTSVTKSDTTLFKSEDFEPKKEHIELEARMVGTKFSKMKTSTKVISKSNEHEPSTNLELKSIKTAINYLNAPQLEFKEIEIHDVTYNVLVLSCSHDPKNCNDEIKQKECMTLAPITYDNEKEYIAINYKFGLNEDIKEYSNKQINLPMTKYGRLKQNLLACNEKYFGINQIVNFDDNCKTLSVHSKTLCTVTSKMNECKAPRYYFTSKIVDFFYQTYHPRDSNNYVLPESLKVKFDDNLLEKLPDSIDNFEYLFYIHDYDRGENVLSNFKNKVTAHGFLAFCSEEDCVEVHFYGNGKFYLFVEKKEELIYYAKIKWKRALTPEAKDQCGSLMKVYDTIVHLTKQECFAYYWKAWPKDNRKEAKKKNCQSAAQKIKKACHMKGVPKMNLSTESEDSEQYDSLPPQAPLVFAASEDSSKESNVLREGP